MTNYIYQNTLIGKKQLRQLLAWSFTNYDSMQACSLADDLKYLGFKYATLSGISLNIEDLKIPFVKNLILEKSTQEIIDVEKIYLKGKITDVERFQKIIDTWSLTSESLKEQVIYYFKHYDPLNSLYIMAFSGARGNLSQVRQLVGMRGLMSNPSGQIMNLAIKKNFREGLTITDYLMSGYGARKGIVDTALKTANSGYLTRRLIDVGQDILIREKDCLTTHSFLMSLPQSDTQNLDKSFNKLLGQTLNKSIIDPEKNIVIVKNNSLITPEILDKCKEHNINKFYLRSPLSCNLYRAVCQKCYGYDLADENLVDVGEAVGIIAGQSIGEPGTQLTMRTFHTGGIFTSEARQQIISLVSGVVKFSKNLKTALLRTNRGEEVLITKNSGSVAIISKANKQTIKELEILRNTILFPKNHQYITKNTVVGELLNLNKQLQTEIKPILSDTCGEIFIPLLKNKINLLNSNKFIWILYGLVYNCPQESFINFYPDYKLKRKSCIFRTKIINDSHGKVVFINNSLPPSQPFIRILKTKCLLKNVKFKKFTQYKKFKNSILILNNFKYTLKVNVNNSKVFLCLTKDRQIGTLLSQKFKTLTGGIIFYDSKNLIRNNRKNNKIQYFSRTKNIKKYNGPISHKTIVWLGKETYIVNCEINILLVEHNDFVSEGFELIPGLFSKTSGLVFIKQKSNLVKTISIKSGLVYEGKKLKDTDKKLYYPGELLFSNLAIKQLCFCEHITGKSSEMLENFLIRPIEIYEFVNVNSPQVSTSYTSNSKFQLESKAIYSYKSNQQILSTKNLNLISNTLVFNTSQFINSTTKLELSYTKNTNSINFQINEKLYLDNFILPSLRYRSIKPCFLLQPEQFLDQYTILGYFEDIILNSLEIVKVKIKSKKFKQILLISNDYCYTVEKRQFPNKKLNDFIVNNSNVKETGKVIIEGSKRLTVQKGRPYFFPNCKFEKLHDNKNIEYKIVSRERVKPTFSTNRLISLNYYDTTKLIIQNSNINKQTLKTKNVMKTQFSKLFIKRNSKFYSSLLPQFYKKFAINRSKIKSINNKIFYPQILNTTSHNKLNRTLLFQDLGLKKNSYKNLSKSNCEILLADFSECPFTQSTKSIGLYATTEDYFEQDLNSVFCKNSQFIEERETVGLLKLEKEITGDIVQGLPRIEEILEARKKNKHLKKIPTSQKKGLLIQKTNLDPNFEFCQLGVTVKENEKINPHKLLKVYFNYYGLIKTFVCERTHTIKYARLINNDEGTYKSFKKVQAFILSSVQAIYKSQGVTINDKHLEVIIKQMTTRVLITYEGTTPLLQREVIDLYHIQYINEVVKRQGKELASYIPLLLGITQAALNNPSFISAASFQETTRVLTKASIEGRIDWLRGLKENIIIGHLIPAGTGSKIYQHCFKKNFITNKFSPSSSESNKNLLFEY